MSLALGFATRIFPLTRVTFKELAGDKGFILGNVCPLDFPGAFLGVDSPSEIGFVPDGATYNQEGKYWNDVFKHRELLKRIPATNLDSGRTRIEFKDDKFHAFPLYWGSGNKPIENYPTSIAEPLPDDTPPVTFMKPVRDEKFVDEIIRAGAEYKLYDKYPAFRWSYLYEVNAGLVAAEDVTGKWVLLACCRRYRPLELSKTTLNKERGWWEIPLTIFDGGSLGSRIEERVAYIRLLTERLPMAMPADEHDEVVFVPHQRKPELWKPFVETSRAAQQAAQKDEDERMKAVY